MSTIGVLTTSYPRHREDVAGIFVRGMARALAQRGHAIEVLAPAPREPSVPPSEPGIEVRYVDYAPPALRATFYGAGVPDNVRHDPLAWPGLVSFPVALHALARQRAPRWDALISHWALPCALVAGRVRAGRPHLAVLHSADVHLVRRLPLRAAWASAIAASATELLFASAELRRELLSWMPPLVSARMSGHAHASAMGIDPIEELGPRRALRDALGLDRFTLLSIGRLVPIKGLEHVVDAIAGDPSLELVVLGEGPSRDALAERARARDARVRFLGVDTGRHKASLLRAADAFVMPSVRLDSGRSEGTPTAALEAAQAGLPIVASAVGGLRELVEHERSGLLVPPGDVAALRAALLRLQVDGTLRRRLARGAKREGARYLWKELAPRLESLLLP